MKYMPQRPEFEGCRVLTIVIKVTVVAPKVPLCYGCNFHAIFMPPTKKCENPWAGFELTPSEEMLDLLAITTTQ